MAGTSQVKTSSCSCVLLVNFTFYFLSAPVHGLYFFNLFFIGTSKPAPSTNLDIMVNNVRQCVAFSDFANRHNTGTCSIMVELQAGDTVHVEHEDPHNDGGVAWNGPYTGFSGFLYQRLSDQSVLRN